MFSSSASPCLKRKREEFSVVMSMNSGPSLADHGQAWPPTAGMGTLNLRGEINSRTMKRTRSKPNEREVHDYTLQRLFNAQKSKQQSNQVPIQPAPPPLPSPPTQKPSSRPSTFQNTPPSAMRPSHLYLHRSRFVDYTPPSITTLAFSHPNLSKSSLIPATLRLAIGRSNGDIEIWNPLKGSWFHESTLKGGKGRSIEGLAWIQDTLSDGGQLRLFSIGYSSVVTEWDLESGRPRKHVDCNGGVIWSIAAQPRVLSGMNQDGGEPRQDLVVGLDDGSVTLLSTDGGPGFLEYNKPLMRSSSTKARVLCLAWQNRYTVVAGMADSTIRVWDIRSGRVVTRMTLGKDTKRKGGSREALIWAVKVLRNGDIVSGDSRGEVMFWDGKTYSLRQRIKAHEADVLTLDVNKSGDMVVASGVDRRTVFIGLQQAGPNKGRWAELSGQRVHSHDVRAIAAWEGGSMSTIVSGGVDMTPIITPFANFLSANHRTLQAIPQKPIVACIPESRLLMSWYDREVKIWAIDKLDNVTGALKKPGLESTGRKLVSRLILGNEENITSAHFAPIARPNAGYILAIATNAEVKIFHLRLPKPRTLSYALRVSKVEIPDCFSIKKGSTKDTDSTEGDSGDDSDDENDVISITQDGARILQFSPDGKWLLVITPESKVVIVPVEVTESMGERRSKVSVSLSPEIFVLDRISRTLPHEKTQRAKELRQPNVQTPGKKGKNTRVFDYGNLSSYPHTISRIAFSSNSKILVVTDLMGHLDSYIFQDEQWVRNPAGGLLPKLEYPVAAMEFRPQSPHLLPATTSEKSDGGPQQARGEGLEEDRLMVLTAHNQAVFEFHILRGRLTDWSRRNPPSRFVSDFRNVVDVGCGIIWEIEELDSPPSGETTFTKERVWFWGPNWIWMFDLQQDFPDQDVISSTVTPADLSGQNQANKRKRGVVNSGMLGDASSHKRLDRDGDVAMFDDATPSGDDDDFDNDDDDSADSHWRKFSCTPGKPTDSNNAALVSVNSKKQDSFARVKRASNPTKPHWRHYKYRPIMALLPLGEWGPRVRGVDEEVEEVKELVVVERPAWDIELPPRFFGKRERTDELRRRIWA
ncbi:WD40-repeat-containing domain protein [Tirmania nivea]|nr:WD40-repeat-containing domain protein [Tirmania nivea]